MPGSLRAEQAELTRKRILDAAVEELSIGGMVSFSTAGVAKRAGISERTIYRHYPDRESLLAGLETARLNTEMGQAGLPKRCPT